jgi:integrase
MKDGVQMSPSSMTCTPALTFGKWREWGRYTQCWRAAPKVRLLLQKLPTIGLRCGSTDGLRWEGVVGLKESAMYPAIPSFVGFAKAPWNKGRLIGQKRPLRPREVWAIRVRLQLEKRRRDLALFNLAIDSRLRGCDLVRLRVSDVCVGGRVQDRATVIQRKTGRPVQFGITEQTRAAIRDWLASAAAGNGEYLFPSRFRGQAHISTRQYARIRPSLG